MRILFVGVSMLALVAPAAHAQTPREPPVTARSQQVEPGVYRVFFAFNSAALNSDAQRTVAQAANEFKRTGAARISLVGHADLVGTDAYNFALGKRRANSVQRELVRRGVPASAIATESEGETDPLVRTAPGVREPRNRRVVIRFPQPGAPEGETPVAAASALPEPAAGPVQAARRMLSGTEVTLGGFYGLNLEDAGDDDKESHLGGLEAGVAFNLLPNVALSLKQAGFYNFLAEDEGFGGRSVVGVNLQGSWGAWRPYVGANFGGIYGKGIEDDLLAGPEIGVKIDTSASSFLYARGAYDVLFDRGWGEGVAVGGIGLGWRY